MGVKTGSPDLLPLLRSELQGRLLERLLSDPDRPRTVAEFAEAFDVSGQAVRNELRRLLRAGIVEEQRVGRAALYRPAVESPIYEPLRQIVERTVGVEPQLRRALAALPGVQTALIYGSWAAGTIRPDSDVDVLVIGDVDYAALVEEISEVQERSGREVNLVAMTQPDFRKRLADGSGFIRSIVAAEKLPLVGNLTID